MTARADESAGETREQAVKRIVRQAMMGARMDTETFLKEVAGFGYDAGLAASRDTSAIRAQAFREAREIVLHDRPIDIDTRRRLSNAMMWAADNEDASPAQPHAEAVRRLVEAAKALALNKHSTCDCGADWSGDGLSGNQWEDFEAAIKALGDGGKGLEAARVEQGNDKENVK